MDEGRRSFLRGVGALAGASLFGLGCENRGDVRVPADKIMPDGEFSGVDGQTEHVETKELEPYFLYDGDKLRAEFLQKLEQGNHTEKEIKIQKFEWARIYKNEVGDLYKGKGNLPKYFKYLLQNPEERKMIVSTVSELSNKYNIPHEIIFGVIGVESGGSPFASSSSDPSAKGILQLTPDTARIMGLRVETAVDKKDTKDLLEEIGGFSDCPKELSRAIRKFLFDYPTIIKNYKIRHKDKWNKKKLQANAEFVGRKLVSDFLERLPKEHRDYTQAELAKKDERFDTVKCLEAGVKYMEEQYQNFGTLAFALCAYSGGPKNFRVAVAANNKGIEVESGDYGSFTKEGKKKFTDLVQRGDFNIVTYYSRLYNAQGTRHSVQYPFWVMEMSKQMRQVANGEELLPVSDRLREVDTELVQTQKQTGIKDVEKVGLDKFEIIS